MVCYGTLYLHVDRFSLADPGKSQMTDLAALMFLAAIYDPVSGPALQRLYGWLGS